MNTWVTYLSVRINLHYTFYVLSKSQFFLFIPVDWFNSMTLVQTLLIWWGRCESSVNRYFWARISCADLKTKNRNWFTGIGCQARHSPLCHHQSPHGLLFLHFWNKEEQQHDIHHNTMGNTTIYITTPWASIQDIWHQHIKSMPFVHTYDCLDEK